MRHGTTCWNERGITQGRTNNRLSKNGIELTKKVSEELKDEKINIIFCSPLMRTIQTANIINKKIGVKIIKDQRLIEVEQGIFTGRHKDDLTEEERKLKYAHAKECGMESYQEIFERTKNFVDDLKKNCHFENVLIITHNCNASIMQLILENREIDFQKSQNFKAFKNAEVKSFDIT